MSDEKIKVSELPEDEQKALIQEAYSLGIQGVLTGMKVTTLKGKIEKQKEQLKEQNGSNNEQNGEETTEENTSNDEQKDEETTEENGSNNEQNGEETTEENTSNDEQNGEETTEENTSNDEQIGEVTTEENTSNDEQKDEEANEETEELIAGETIPQKEEKNKGKSGICHICGSRVENGKCTGCNFIR